MTASRATGQNGATTPADVSPTWRATLALLRRLPQGALSRAAGRLADIPVPRSLRRRLYGSFASVAGVDLTEAERPLSEYRTFDDFFTRRLRDGVRRWPLDPATIASPVDGTLGEFGTIRDGVLMQAKGRPYSAAGLLDDDEDGARFDGGAFITIYLSPRDYHRIHAPASGSVARVRHVPGALLPVNTPAIHAVADLFPRNERVVCHLDAATGGIAVVAVGAFNVGRIEVVFDQTWQSNRTHGAPRNIEYDPAHEIERGDELMVFHLGSTVVLLLDPERARLSGGLRTGHRIRLGEPVGSLAG